MKKPSVTIVIVPRERFSLAVASLRDVIDQTPEDVPIVYVDGNSPQQVRQALDEAADHRTRFVRFAEFLSPNRARNLGFAEVDTEFVVFLDNDVWVEPNWLQMLLDCARERQAAVVSPLYLQGRHEDREVHMAGGIAHIVQEEGKRRIRATHDHQGKPVDEVLPLISRCETELAEFHGVLIRSDVLRSLGGLDEGLLCSREHIDFCMTVRNQGGKIMLEPASQITYQRPPPFGRGDLAFFSLRWSEDWTQRTLDHFFTKWDLDRAQIPHLMTWSKKQRYRFLDPWYTYATQFLARTAGRERVVKILQYTLYPLEGALNRLIVGISTSSRKR
ncbi:MAG: glycosyltransferase family 2 protein [Halieaceae bacterium]|jgi:GT2 family glycosyltransferase|nr:glycosyltransferase family 2 protein [Halieaceae bacterium]